MLIRDAYAIADLPTRPAKPRTEGLTHMLDKGLAPRQAEDVLSVAADYIDLVKLGWGTSVITPGLHEKLAIYRAAGLPVYFGGTLFEAMYLRGQLDLYRQMLRDLEIDYIEVSDGIVSMRHEDKCAVIADLAEEFTVLSEVGSKDAAHIMPPYRWVEMIEAELEAGSWKVICEARETGTAGLFRPNGEIRSGLVDEIVARIDPKHVLFEAPNKMQQVWFIKHLGANVSLGNIAPEEVIPVETLRLGLRGDTLFEFLTPGMAPSVPQHGAASGDGRDARG
jgi:phosphosulfolactate synthase